MAKIKTTSFLEQIVALLSETTWSYENTIAKYQGTLTIARAVYGDGTPQLVTLLEAARVARATQANPNVTFPLHLPPVIIGTLNAMKADLESGLVGSIELQGAGDVIADMLLLAKEALVQGSPGATNVSAVLAAAAFEDTIRRMGTKLASVVGRPDLGDVLQALKTAKILAGAPFTTAQSYLKFRNDALHADWSNLNAALIGSCISFVEGLV